MKTGALLGLDLGTSGAKAVVFDAEGRMLARAQAGYALISPVPGALELNPVEVLRAVDACLALCARQTDVSRVAALAISTQGEAVIPTARDGTPLLHAILTFDARNAPQFERFCQAIHPASVMRLTGMPPSPMFSATKLLWLREHHPQVVEQVWKFCCFGDFVALYLGAEPVMDVSMAARTMLWDCERRDWSEELLALVGITRGQLPRVVPTGTVIGTAGERLTRHGFSPALKLVAGGHDQLCGCIGAGVWQAGEAMLSLGTTESIVCVSGPLADRAALLDANIPVYPYPWENLSAYMTFLTTCASLCHWFRDKIAMDPRAEFYEEYEAVLRERYREPSGLYVLPHFAGAGTPTLDASARGLLYGLTLETDRYRLYRGILEGICYETRANLEAMEQQGLAVHTLRCIGGGAGSAFWLQMQADITGRRVLSTECPEAGCLGAALLAGLACGVLPNHREARERFCVQRREYWPDPQASARYEPHFQVYGRLHPLASAAARGVRHPSPK